MALSVFAAAAEAPDRVALITDDRALTFSGLAHRVRQAVDWLQGRGLAGNEPVALVARADLPTLELTHALMAMGTPALLLHPRLTPGERNALVAATGPAGVVEGDWRLDAGGTGPEREPGGQDPEPAPDDERPLAIVHTSGTSGTPRGVILSRRAFVASAAASAANLGWEPDDRWLLPLPLAHVGGLSIVTRCLLARRAVVLASHTDSESMLAAIHRHRITLLSVVPTLLERLLRTDSAGPPESLRAVLVGGAGAPARLLEEAADRGWPVLTTYGLTETCSQATTQTYGTMNRGELGSGRPLPGVELRIGTDQEIQVRGPTLFSGYVPPRPGGSPDDGWFGTGDRGRIDEQGNLHVLGRRSDRIITGGENVDPTEVEEALEGLPGVERACVFGVADTEWGERVCAAIVPAGPGPGPGGGVAEAQVLAALRPELKGLRSVLAGYKLPRKVAILDSLPLNPTGKVDRKEAARRAGPRLRPL